MACTITSGRDAKCADNLGGLRNIYILNYEEGATYDLNGNGALEFWNGSETVVYQFQLLNGSTFEETITSSRDNGTTFYEQILTLNLNTIDEVTTAKIALLAKGRPRIIIEDNNTNLWIAGLDRGCDVTGGSITRGAAMSDKSGYTLTFSAKEKLPAPYLTTRDGLTSIAEILEETNFEIDA